MFKRTIVPTFFLFTFESSSFQVLFLRVPFSLLDLILFWWERLTLRLRSEELLSEVDSDAILHRLFGGGEVKKLSLLLTYPHCLLSFFSLLSLLVLVVVMNS